MFSRSLCTTSAVHIGHFIGEDKPVSDCMLTNLVRGFEIPIWLLLLQQLYNKLHLKPFALQQPFRWGQQPCDSHWRRYMPLPGCELQENFLLGVVVRRLRQCRDKCVAQWTAASRCARSTCARNAAQEAGAIEHRCPHRGWRGQAGTHRPLGCCHSSAADTKMPMSPT